MFYDPRENLRPASLRHNPFLTLVAPRPIGWVSTISSQGQANLAPFSYFNGIGTSPPMVMFAPNAQDKANTPKDTFRNISEVPEFVVNVATYELREAVNETSRGYKFGVSEIEKAGLTAMPAVNVRPPRVKEAPAALECEVYQTVELPPGQDGRQGHVVIGRVVGIYISDELIDNGIVNQLGLQQLARLGSSYYSWVDEIFEMRRPK